MKSFKYTLFLLCLIAFGMASLPTSAQNQVIKVYRDGKVIKQYNASEIDAIEVADIEDEEEKPVTHEYVDLGLPSGLKWASCNIGATSPYDYGHYFAWGETAPNTNYCPEVCLSYGKSMQELRQNGIIDASGTLTKTFDAAAVNWGGSWRMPTSDECQELSQLCTWTEATINDVTGFEVTGPNGNHIFLPLSGFYMYDTLLYSGYYGQCWSSSLYEEDDVTNSAAMLTFSSYGFGNGFAQREGGRSIRPVSE